ncbi:hypothetical protein KRR40_36870 [Niabella defluvii]|nr:hypothetical protein KRR40_36870 [Niabella sp. I65]
MGTFSFDLEDFDVAQQLTVHVSVNEQVQNSWNIWVFPKNETIMQSTDDILYTTTYDDKAKQFLSQGKKVVLCPLPSNVKGRASTFHNHFWNPIMFAWAPMTIGALIHEDHPVFNRFVTSYHTDWQWWDILNNAKVIEMKNAPKQLRPFIQIIDAYDNNEKLGIGFEAKIGNGKLLVLAVDTQKEINKRPATRQLLASVDEYVKSTQFEPQVAVEESFIRSFLLK